jgi:uncharacterized protein involved in exopolysaccharide biosynthesis
MARLLRLEQGVGELKQAVLQITEILVDQSRRMDAARDEALELRRGLTERLDRLIAVTIEERTQGFGRLRELERRVERLEERVGTT